MEALHPGPGQHQSARVSQRALNDSTRLTISLQIIGDVVSYSKGDFLLGATGYAHHVVIETQKHLEVIGGTSTRISC